MNVKAVIFDMDGLIYNSEPIQSKSYEILLKSYRKRPIFNKDGVIQKVGITTTDNLNTIKKQYGITDDVKILANKKHKIYLSLLKNKLPVMEGFIELLKNLNENYIKTAIASSSHMEIIQIVVSRLKIDNYLNNLISGEELKRGKPYPDIFLEAAKKLNTDPAECVVFEDAESGVIAGKRAGMKVIAVPNQYTKSHNFSKADKIVASLKEINLKMLENL